MKTLIELYQQKQCETKFVIFFKQNQNVKQLQDQFQSDKIIFQSESQEQIKTIQDTISKELKNIALDLNEFTFNCNWTIEQLKDFCFGNKYEKYEKIFQNYESGICSQPLHYGDIFFRCYTCELFTHDSIFVLFCENCFRNGNHQNHQIGIRIQKDQGVHGCCDCGDTAAFKETSFCKNHKGYQLQNVVLKDISSIIYQKLLILIQNAIYTIFYINKPKEELFNLLDLFLDFIEEIIADKPALKIIFSILLKDSQSIIVQKESNILQNIFKKQKVILPKHQEKLQALFIEFFANKEFKIHLTNLFGEFFHKTFQLKIKDYIANQPFQIFFPKPIMNSKEELQKILLSPVLISNKIQIRPISKFAQLITQFLSPDTLQFLMKSNYLSNYLKVYQKIIILTYASEYFDEQKRIESQEFIEHFFFQMDTISTKKMVLQNTEKLVFISEYLRLLGKFKYFDVTNTEFHTYVEFWTLKDFSEYIFCQIDLDFDTQTRISTFENLLNQFFTYFQVFQNQKNYQLVPLTLIKAFAILVIHNINQLGIQKIIEIINKNIPKIMLQQILLKLFENVFLIYSVNYIMRNTGQHIQQDEISKIIKDQYQERFNFKFTGEGFSGFIYNSFIENYDICFMQFCFVIIDPKELFQLMINKFKILESNNNSIYMLQTLLEIIIIITTEELACLNCIQYPEDYPYPEQNLNSIKNLLINLLFSQQNSLNIENIQNKGRKIFKFDMDYAFFLDQLTIKNEESKTLVLKEQYFSEIEPMQWLRFTNIQQQMDEELELKVKKNSDKFDMILSMRSEKFIDRNLINRVAGYYLFSDKDFFQIWDKLMKILLKQIPLKKENSTKIITQILTKVLKIESLILTSFELNNQNLQVDNLIQMSNQIKQIQQLIEKNENQEDILQYKPSIKKLLIKIDNLNQLNQSMHLELQETQQNKNQKNKVYLKKQQDILKQFQLKQQKFYEKNDEIKQEIDQVDYGQENQAKCYICREGDNKEKFGYCAYLNPDNFSYFYSKECKIIKNEEDFNANSNEINWIITTCNHLIHQECADTNQVHYTHMIKNDSERVCTFCKSVFNILIPILNQDMQFPEIKLEKIIDIFTIQDFESLLFNQQLMTTELLKLQNQQNYQKVIKKLEWLENQIENNILIAITDLNQDQRFEIDLIFESPFQKNLQKSILFQFNQMFVNGVYHYLNTNYQFLRNLFLCYCIQFQKIFQQNNYQFQELYENYNKLKTGEFLQLPFSKFEQFISGIILEIGMLFISDQESALKAIGLVYHLFINHLNSIYKSQLQQLNQEGINMNDSLQNYLLPFKRHILGIMICCIQFDNKCIDEILLSENLDECAKYDLIFNKLFRIPKQEIFNLINIEENILSVNPCKQPQFIVQLPENFLDFHYKFLLQRCDICKFYSKRNMGELYVCLICGLCFCSACEKSKFINESDDNQDELLYAHANLIHLGQTIVLNCQTSRISLVDRKKIYEINKSIYVNSCGIPIKIYTKPKNWELYKLDKKRLNFFEHLAFSRKIIQQLGQEIADKPPQQCNIF